MKILRKTEIDTTDFQIGDTIDLQNGYTATCQLVTDAGFICYYDQYLDACLPMNKRNTNRGGYEASDLRAWLRDPETVSELLPEALGLQYGTFSNGDALRLATVGEIFGGYKYAEPDEAAQWPLMKDPRNRVAFHRSGDWDWGWLQNKAKDAATGFCHVDDYGGATHWGASNVVGVRPAFLIKRS